MPEYNPPFSHKPKSNDKYPIEVPPSDELLGGIINAIGDFFAGIGRGVKHLFTRHYCEVVTFDVRILDRTEVPATAGVAAAQTREFHVTAEFDSKGAECGCCEYRQFVRGRFINRMGGTQNYQIAGGSLDQTTFREDGYPSGGGYVPRGHRELPGTDVDKYLPDQKLGCKYESQDSPQCGLDERLELRGSWNDC